MEIFKGWYSMMTDSISTMEVKMDIALHSIKDLLLIKTIPSKIALNTIMVATYNFRITRTVHNHKMKVSNMNNIVR